MEIPTGRRLVIGLVVTALVVTACTGGSGQQASTSEPGDAAPSASTATGSDSSPTRTEADAGATEAAQSADGYDWSDVRRRQSVSLAIDTQEIVDVVFQGTRTVGDDFWPPTLVGHRGGDWCPNLQHDPDRAAAMWEEAGGDQGPITFWLNSGAGHDEWVQAIANQLQNTLDVSEVRFQSLPFAAYLDKLESAEVDGPFRLGWLAPYPSPGFFLGPLHATAAMANSTGYSNPDFDAAVAAGDGQPLDEAIADYQSAGDILCTDLPIIPVMFPNVQYVHSENVGSVSFDASQALRVTETTDLDGDGSVSMYICEPQNPLFGLMTMEDCGGEVVNGLFTGLWTLDKQTGEPVFDAVAEAFEANDDATEWTITLKDGWTFHDGSPVTAQSFVDAWNWGAHAPNGSLNTDLLALPNFAGYADVATCGTRAASPEDVEAERAREVGEEISDCDDQPPVADTMTGLEAVGDTTIRITLDEPFPQLPLVLETHAFDPLPPSFFEAAAQGREAVETWGRAPVGNGPFMIPDGGGWEHEVEVATVRYDDYGGGTARVEELVYRIYAEDTTAYNDLRAGALDVMDHVPTAELTRVKDEFGDRYGEEPASTLDYLGFPIDLDLVASWHG